MIAGSMVFTVFNRDALIEEFKEKINGENTGVQKFKANNTSEGDVNFISVEDWDAQMSDLASVGSDTGDSVGNTSSLVGKYQAVYADELLPFDITITFKNKIYYIV